MLKQILVACALALALSGCTIAPAVPYTPPAATLNADALKTDLGTCQSYAKAMPQSLSGSRIGSAAVSGAAQTSPTGILVPPPLSWEVIAAGGISGAVTETGNEAGLLPQKIDKVTADCLRTLGLTRLIENPKAGLPYLVMDPNS